uniref:Uncharacterized protein n=1 Tax=Knipowitschia caucasica TaxID=637954 RepID=A0AAV2MM78_KNICA
MMMKKKKKENENENENEKMKMKMKMKKKKKKKEKEKKNNNNSRRSVVTIWTDRTQARACPGRAQSCPSTRVDQVLGLSGSVRSPHGSAAGREKPVTSA